MIISTNAKEINRTMIVILRILKFYGNTGQPWKMTSWKNQMSQRYSMGDHFGKTVGFVYQVSKEFGMKVSW